MVIKATLAFALIAAALAVPALAEQPDAAAGTVVTSEPGKASVVRTIETSAKVVGIDNASRTVTLQGPKGKTVEVVAGDAVKNFDKIKLGDVVVARYTEAVALKLRKAKGDPGEVIVSEGSSEAKPGADPAFVSGRQVTTIAEVTAVDPKESTITLKGPQGKVVTIDVNNPAQFNVVKPGDQVEVTYSQAMALSVEPPAAAAPMKDAPAKKE
jgi:hypothetical protein